MNILITGGGGFIGSHLVDSQLAKGHQVRTIDLELERLAHTAEHPRLEMIRGSIDDAELLPRLVVGVDLVYHLAAAHLDVTLPDEVYRRINVTGSLDLARAAHQAGARRFVLVSTNSVIGEMTDPPVDETAPCHPTNIYERTKLGGELALLQYSLATGFPIVVIRPAWVYGPRCPRTAKLLRTIGKGRFVMFGDGQTLRHPLYIDDAVRALELAGSAKKGSAQVYFVAGEEPVTIQELVEQIAAAQQVRPPAVHLPLWMGKAAGYAAELAFKPLGKQPPISSRTLDFFTKNNAYKIGKARRDLGFKPKIDLAEGLRLTLAAENDRADLTPTEREDGSQAINN